MANLTLKNLPDKVMAHLREKAKRNQRSLNNEAIIALQIHALKQERISADEVIRQARELRIRAKGMLSLNEVEKAINEGRP